MRPTTSLSTRHSLARASHGCLRMMVASRNIMFCGKLYLWRHHQFLTAQLGTAYIPERSTGKTDDVIVWRQQSAVSSFPLPGDISHYPSVVRWHKNWVKVVVAKCTEPSFMFIFFIATHCKAEKDEGLCCSFYDHLGTDGISFVESNKCLCISAFLFNRRWMSSFLGTKCTKEWVMSGKRWE